MIRPLKYMVTIIADFLLDPIIATTSVEIFVQNKSSPMDQVINDCMTNNVTAGNVLKHYNSITYP